MEGDLGVYAVADVKQAFRGDGVTRKDYEPPGRGRGWSARGKNRTLPAPADFDGLTDFSRTTFRDSKGAVVVDDDVSSYCPNVVRARAALAQGAAPRRPTRRAATATPTRLRRGVGPAGGLRRRA